MAAIAAHCYRSGKNSVSLQGLAMIVAALIVASVPDFSSAQTFVSENSAKPKPTPPPKSSPTPAPTPIDPNYVGLNNGSWGLASNWDPAVVPNGVGDTAFYDCAGGGGGSN